MKLYEITESMARLDDMLSLEEIDTQTYNDTLESIQFELQSKSNDISKYITELERQSEAVNSEIKRLQELKKTRENKIESIKNYVTQAMQKMNLKKIDTDFALLSLRKSESIEVTNISEIPSEYKTTTIEEKADKTAIKKAIKQGIEITGVKLIEKDNLQIK